MAPFSGGLAGNSPPVIAQSRGTFRGCFAAAGKGPLLGRMPMGPGHLSRARGAGGAEEQGLSPGVKQGKPHSSWTQPGVAKPPRTTARALLLSHCACGHGLSFLPLTLCRNAGAGPRRPQEDERQALADHLQIPQPLPM